MPFYAKDWRSPGESWIKTEDGWEKLKILECRRRRSRYRNIFLDYIVTEGVKEHAVNDIFMLSKWVECIR